MGKMQRFSTVRHVAIVGAGFSGSLQAINLVRHNGPRATLIERLPHAGRGIAYSTAHPDHRLNVRASNMSALPDDTAHFSHWLAENHPDLGPFAPRKIYGDYLAQLLADAKHGSDERLQLLSGNVVAIHFEDGCARLTLGDGRSLTADSVILAQGNLPPHILPALQEAKLDTDRFVADPWQGDFVAGLNNDDVVLIIGTGLTMVDVALLLESKGFEGRIIAMSRRGLSPHSHSAMASANPLSERPSTTLSALVRAVRTHSAKVGWHAAVDALRPYTQSMWRGADDNERKRFLRHLRPYWDIHRHRLAPEVFERITAMRERGQLTITAGKMLDAAQSDKGVRVRYRPRGGPEQRKLDVRRIVNCSGPQGDVLRASDPLLRQLLANGFIRSDPLALGIDVNAQAEAIGADGRANPHLLVLGPMTRGIFWEIVAVPDIRVQTWSVARRLSHAHWAAGEI